MGVDDGLWSWRQEDNNHKLLDLQHRAFPNGDGGVTLEFFGGSAFRIISPAGLTLLIDPWRNHPGNGAGQWFYHAFPPLVVDIGLSTHAHMDHDALHVLHANMLLDRMVGAFALADVSIQGIADKHVADFSGCIFNFTEELVMRGVEVFPPHNVRAYDNTLFIVETGGLRILHWGDNRPDPPETVWQRLVDIDVVLLPIDESRHILTYPQIDVILERLRPKVCIPHHFRTRGLVRHASTLMSADDWVRGQPDHVFLDSAAVMLDPRTIAGWQSKVLHFGDNLAFPLPALPADGLRRGIAL